MSLFQINNNITLHIDDCLKVLSKLDDQSIDVIITSPPYWGQRDYKNDSQWGSEDKVELFLEKFKLWSKECFRILKNTGSLFLNIGDKYSKKSLNLIPERIAIMLCDNNWCLRNNIIWYKPNHMPSSVKDRLSNTYEHVYFFVKDSGKYYNYNYFSDIDAIRIKNDNIKSDNLDFPLTISIDEYTNTFKNKVEDFNKAKQQKYKGKFKNETKNMGQSPGARQSKGISYSLQRIHKLNKSNSLEINKFILYHYTKSKLSTKQIDQHFNYKDTASHWIRTDPGRSLPKSDDWFPLKKLLNITDNKFDDKMTSLHYVLQNVKNNPKGKNPGDLWKINTEKCKESHFAVFPIELPLKIIKGFCPEDGIVLDPFAGSGTTGVAAMKSNKKCILIDCNPDFKTIIEKRIKNL